MSPSAPLDSAAVLPRLVAERAESDADHRFLIEIGVGTATFAELQERVQAWVGVFAFLGLERGDRLATICRPSIDATAVWLACGWAGLLEVPVNTAFVGRMLRHVITDAGAQVAVVQSKFLPGLAAIAQVLPHLRRVVVIEPANGADETTRVETTAVEVIGSRDVLADSAPQSNLGPAPQPWDVSAVLYTSGTTGPSKGVLVPWGQVATSLQAFDDCRTGDRLFAPFEPSHLAGKIPVQLMAYWSGTHVLRDGFRTSEFWSDVIDNDCNRVWLFHAMANFVWRQPPRDDDADNPIETITGGPLLHEFREFEERFGVRMRTNYGMTEAGWPIVTGPDVRNHLSCGRPRAGYDLRIVDEHDREQPPGEVGELILRSDTPWTMNLGYFGLPERTVDAWRNGWFHTGDAFRVDDDGNWYFVDRMKDAIRRRAENVSSFEVESMVGEHEAVLECAAIGVPSDDGEEEIKVCVVLKPCAHVSPEALTEFLEPRVPSFMLPRYLEFVDVLPKTPTGKVRKFELKREPFGASTWDRRTSR